MKNNYTFVIPAPILTFVGMGAGMTIKVLDDLNLEMALLVSNHGGTDFVVPFQVGAEVDGC